MVSSNWPTCLSHCQQRGGGGWTVLMRHADWRAHPALQSQSLQGVRLGRHTSVGNQSEADLIFRPRHLMEHRLESQADPVPGWGSRCRKWVVDLGETWSGRAPLEEDTGPGRRVRGVQPQ